jgi:hypothetical protein
LILSPLLAGKAFGVTVPGPVDVLCDGDCAGLAVTDIVPSDAPLEFELGLRITGSGLDLSVRSEGSVFLRSPIRATDSIRLVGGRDIRIGPGVLVSSAGGSIDLRAGDVRFEEPSTVRPLPSGGGVVVIGAPDRVIEVPRLSITDLPEAPDCACINIAGSNLTLPRVSSGSLSVLSGALVPLAADGVTTGSRIQLAGGTTTAGSTRSIAPSVAAQGGKAPADPRVPGYVVTRAGDLYIDLSGVVLANLDVDAKLDLYLDGAGAIPTPEPGGTLLIGLGLALLALRRSAR